MTAANTIPSPGEGRKPGALLNTPTAEAMSSLFQVCQAEGELGIVTGEPGVGKTSASKLYASQMPSVFMVTMSPASSSLVGCLARIAEELPAYPATLSGPGYSEAIRLELRRSQDPPLLIVDEAHHLSDIAVEEIRSIFDAIPNLGVVFVGSREMRERWSGRRWAQLTSRVFLRIDMDGPMPPDVDAICADAGVEGNRARDLMRRAAARPGGLRVVRKLLGVAAKLAAGGPIKLEHVEAAFRNRGRAQNERRTWTAWRRDLR